MARNDIQLVDNGAFGACGDITYQVAAGTTIYAGEPVVVTKGTMTATAGATNSPAVASHVWAGIATTDSTATASVAGTVQVRPIMPGQIYEIKPKVAATWDTQTEYDALLGYRVLIDLTSSSYTILAADSAANGCIVMPNDVKKNPGKVRFTFVWSISNLWGQTAS